MQQGQSTLSASEIKLAEVETGLDLDGDNTIGGTVTSTAYSNNAAGTDSWNNFTIYNTEVGMVTAIGDYSLTVGDDLRAIAWDINGSTTAATTSQGFNLLTNNGRLQLDNGQSILTAKVVGSAGYLISKAVFRSLNSSLPMKVEPSPSWASTMLASRFQRNNSVP